MYPGNIVVTILSALHTEMDGTRSTLCRNLSRKLATDLTLGKAQKLDCLCQKQVAFNS